MPHNSGQNSSNEIPNPYNIVLYTLPDNGMVKKFLLFYGTSNLTSCLKFMQAPLCPELDESVYTLKTYYILLILTAFFRPHLDLPNANFKSRFMATIYSSLLNFPCLIHGQSVAVAWF